MSAGQRDGCHKLEGEGLFYKGVLHAKYNSHTLQLVKHLLFLVSFHKIVSYLTSYCQATASPFLIKTPMFSVIFVTKISQHRSEKNERFHIFKRQEGKKSQTVSD